MVKIYEYKIIQWYPKFNPKSTDLAFRDFDVGIL